MYDQIAVRESVHAQCKVENHAYRGLNVNLIIMSFASCTSSYAYYSASLCISALDFCDYVLGDRIDEIGALVLEVAVEASYLRQGLLGAGEESSEGLNG